jgi:hypothetical protein
MVRVSPSHPYNAGSSVRMDEGVAAERCVCCIHWWCCRWGGLGWGVRGGGWGGIWRDAPEYKLIGCIEDHLQQCIIIGSFQTGIDPGVWSSAFGAV